MQSTFFRKIRFHFHVQIVDHAVLRLCWPNLDKVDGCEKAFRSGHPNLRMLRKLKNRGVTTILNLRGGEHKPQNILEQMHCEMLNLEYKNIQLSSVKLPSKDVLLDLVEFYEHQTDPFLMHCKTGADRTGLASGVYLMVVKNVSAELASKQLTTKYLHFGLGRKAILRKFFHYIEKTKLEGQSFKDWVKNIYDPKLITHEV